MVIKLFKVELHIKLIKVVTNISFDKAIEDIKLEHGSLLPELKVDQTQVIRSQAIRNLQVMRT